MQSLHRPLSRLGPSLLCIAAGAAAYQLAGQDTSTTCRCEFPTAPSNPPVPPTAVSVMALRRWLEHQGADISAIDFKASPTVGQQQLLVWLGLAGLAWLGSMGNALANCIATALLPWKHSLSWTCSTNLPVPNAP